jgi:hypothetical protein
MGADKSEELAEIKIGVEMLKFQDCGFVVR